MNTEKLLNFNAGPAALPQIVLQQAAEAVLDYNHSGLSILEIPHRGKMFDAILEESKQLVKELCKIGDDYEVLWMQGGGRLQFCMIPMNFLGDADTAGYIDSGHWAADAIDNARLYGNVRVLASTKDINYTRLPLWEGDHAEGLQYLHITSNNTIYGTQYANLPEVAPPLIVDMSSDILSMERDYSKCAMFYAVVQKNLGAAGVTLAVIRKDMLQHIKRKLPGMLDYAVHAKNNSVYNTPPVFAIYTSLLTLRWIKARGMAQIAAENRRKADLLYAEIERNSLFAPIVTDVNSRSQMNVVFRGVHEQVEQSFLQYCEQHQITGVKGHRSAGGFRASLYNAISEADVARLVSVMQAYEQLDA